MINCKVGTFTLNTSTGNQSVTGLGFTPKCIIFWMAGVTVDATWTVSPRFSVGFTAGASNSFGISSHSTDAAATSNTSSRQAAKALTIVGASEVLLAEFDLVSFDSGGFTINLTTAATAWIVNYLAIGGDEVSANIISWAKNATTGNQAVTGAGFQPSLLFHLGLVANTTVPSSVAHGTLSFGFSDASSSGMIAFRSADNSAAANTQRMQNVAGYGMTNTSLTVTDKFTHVSLDSDGFTVNNGTATFATQIFTLCIKGLRSVVGQVNKPTGVAPQLTTINPNFTPAAVLLTSFQDVTQANPVANTRLGVGACSLANQASIAVHDDDTADPMQADGISDDSFTFQKSDNTTPIVEASCTGAIRPDSIQLTWSTNDAVATELNYLILGRTTNWSIYEKNLGRRMELRRGVQ